jgi:hypothetical protein
MPMRAHVDIGTCSRWFTIAETSELIGYVDIEVPPGLSRVFRVLVELSDDGGTSTTGSRDISPPIEIMISVESRNEPPTFDTEFSRVELNATGRLLEVPDWAVNISAGEGECMCTEECENTLFKCQNVTFTLIEVETLGGGRPSTLKLFQSFHVDPVNGSLMFLPAEHWSGEFRLTLKFTDDGDAVKGGKGMGGSNTTIKNFTLALNIVNEVPMFKQRPDLLIPQADFSNITQRFRVFDNLTAGSGDLNIENLYDPLVRVNSSECSTTVNDIKNVTNCSNIFDQFPRFTSDGYVEFVLAKAQFGDAVLSLEVGNTGPPQAFPRVVFKIEVVAVNQPPSCTVPHPLYLPENAGPQTVRGFATQLSVGPPSESWQHLVFVVKVTADPPDLFAMTPVIDSAGTLLIHVADSRFGTATLHVTCRDNGGTKYGGSNTRRGGAMSVQVKVLANPIVQRIRPGLGSVFGGGTMTVIGRHFGSELSRGYRRDTYTGMQVFIADVPCKRTSFRSDTELVCDGIPPGNGPANVTVTIRDSVSTSPITPQVQLFGRLQGVYSYHSFFVVGTLLGELSKGFLGLGYFSPAVGPKLMYANDTEAPNLTLNATNSSDNGNVTDSGSSSSSGTNDTSSSPAPGSTSTPNRAIIGEVPGRGPRGRVYARQVAVSGAIHSTASMGGKIYIGGSFITDTSAATSHIAALDTSGYAAPVANGVDGSVDTMVTHHGHLVMGGTFTYAYPVSGRAVPCGGLTFLDTASSKWGIVGRTPLNGAVKSLLSHYGNLYVGGRFKMLAGIQVDGIAMHTGNMQDEGGWRSLGGLGVGGYAMVIAAYHTQVIDN